MCIKSSVVCKCILVVVGIVCVAFSAELPADELVPVGWDAQRAGDEVLARLVRVTGPQVKGAHDAEMVLVGRRAYIVAEVNDVKSGESAGWPEIYAALSIVNLDSLEVEAVIPFARSEQVFRNQTLPIGACFVPRILQKNADELRCYFASEQPGQRQAQIWYLDFDLKTGQFQDEIHPARLKTAEGVFLMQPQYFYRDAKAVGFNKPAKDYGLYLFDSFKQFDGKTYVALNNYPGRQNALAVMYEDLATFEVLGHYNEPQAANLSESAVNRLPDGTWVAICRREAGDKNYLFTTSRDGKTWTAAEAWPNVPNGTNSKPTFDRIGEMYYLGWQENSTVEGAHRSVFNVDISRDGRIWERKYRFATPRSFQYPVFREHDGEVWVAVTQGDSSSTRKERIMFGRLEKAGAFEGE